MKALNNLQDYKNLIAEGKPVLLDFYADWCGPCKVLLPTVQKLAEKHKENFNIAKVNVDDNPDLAMQFGVRSIPALFFVQDGKVQESLVGIQTEASLEQRIATYTVTA